MHAHTPTTRLATTLFLLATATAAPALAAAVGVGGGGALYVPSINPADGNEFYVTSDMTELFHTTDYGRSYRLTPFDQVEGGTVGVVRFTSNPAILYAIDQRNDNGTPVKSTDGGTTFAPLAGNPDPSEFIFSINVDYQNPDRVLISQWTNLYLSTNGGTTFNLVYTGADSGAGLIVAGVLFDGTSVYVGTNDGIVVSTNGTTFNLVPVAGLAGNERIFSFAGAKQGATVRFFCLTGDVGNVYLGLTGSDYWDFMVGVYSLDWGGSWTQRMAANGSDFPMYVAMAENDISTAYVGGSNDLSTPIVMKTTNAGASWSNMFQATNNQNVATGWSGDGGDRGWWYGECALGFTVSPSDSSRVIITDFGFVHVTSDGGTTWRQAYVSAADENPPGSTTPTGKAYHSIGLENTSCWQVHWVDQNNLFAPFSDIRGIRSTDGGASWSFDYTGHDGNTMYRVTQHPTTGVLYAGTSNVHDLYQSTRLEDSILDNPDANGKIIFSTNGGADWQDMHFFNHPVFWVALDPTSPTRMYASVVHSTQGGVYVSNDIASGASSTWTKLPNPPRTEGHPGALVVLADGTLVATYSGHRNPGFTASSGTFTWNGSAWSDVSDPGMLYWTKDVVVDPHDATQNTWYVAVFSGWGGAPNGLGGLYRTTNRGQSWTRINADDRVTSCTVSPTTPGLAYLTTEVDGLWTTSDITAATPTFSLVTSYGFRQPERVFWNPYDGSVWVTSFGNGITILGGGGSTSGPQIVTGPGPGSANAPNVRGFDATGAANGATNFQAYGAGGYGVNVALADARGTGSDSDILTGPGPGSVYGPQVRAFRQSGAATAKVNFYAYGTLRFGVRADAGDLDGDAIDEILTAAGPGAVFGPHVRGFNFDGGTLTNIAKINFFAFSTLKFGVVAAGASIDGDGFSEILCGPGPSAVFGSQVRGFNYDGTAVTSLAKVNFFPFTTLFGSHPVGADLDADGIDEILTAPGPDQTATARIRGFNFDGGTLTAIASVDFDGIPGTNRGGANLAAFELGTDGRDDIVVGTGYDFANGSPRVRGWSYDGSTVTALSTLDFSAYPAAQRYGVNVSVGDLMP